MRFLLTVVLVVVMLAIGSGLVLADVGPNGPAPNSGDGVPDGSGLEAPNGPNGDTDGGVGPAPNAGDGIPDGSGF